MATRNLTSYLEPSGGSEGLRLVSCYKVLANISFQLSIDNNGRLLMLAIAPTIKFYKILR
jgi:hypothetical protein